MATLPTSLLRLSELTNRHTTGFDLVVTAAERQAIADSLNIVTVKKLKFAGNIEPQGRSDWVLTGMLGATVIQNCVVTLDPVTTRIDEQIKRTYVAALPDIDANEIEMPDDDTVDQTPETLDLAQVMVEALSLALPAYPRAEGANLGEAVFTKPGNAAMTDDDAKPFAALGALRDSLENKGE